MGDSIYPGSLFEVSRNPGQATSKFKFVGFGAFKKNGFPRRFHYHIIFATNSYGFPGISLGIPMDSQGFP